MPASRMRHGVTKSGSPTPREMTSSISAAMSKKRRIPDGGQVVMTSLSGFTAASTPRGSPEVGGGGLHAFDRRELLRDEVGDGADAVPGHGAPQVVAAGDEVDAAHLGEA